MQAGIIEVVATGKAEMRSRQLALVQVVLIGMDLNFTLQACLATAQKKFTKATALAKNAESVVSAYKEKIAAAKDDAKKEKTLRVKAVATAIKLGKKMSKMGAFGKKASAFAKAQAAKAQAAMAAAKKEVAKINEAMLKAKAYAAKMEAKRRLAEKKLANVAAEKVTAEADLAKQKEERSKAEKDFGKLKDTILTLQKQVSMLQLSVQKRKEKVKHLKRVAGRHEKNEKKALKTFKKVGDIKRAYSIAMKSAEHFKNENKLQRIALARTAAQELVAAKATTAAAARAESIEKQALLERSAYKSLIEKAKSALKHEHQGKLGAKKQAFGLVSKAKVALAHEHLLRTSAEDSKTKYAKAAQEAEAAAEKERAVVLKIKAAAEKINAQNKILMQRQAAMQKMMGVEHQAALEAKQAALDERAAAAKQLAAVKKVLMGKLEREHQSAVTAKKQTFMVTQQTTALQKAVAQEKSILKDEEAKSQKERESWQTAINAMKGEQHARALAQGEFRAQTAHMTEEASQDIKKANNVAATKNALLAKLAKQLKTQESNFHSQAAKWHKEKALLDARAAHAAQAKHQVQESSRIQSAAQAAVNAAIANAVKANAGSAPEETMIQEDDSDVREMLDSVA